MVSSEAAQAAQTGPADKSAVPIAADVAASGEIEPVTGTLTAPDAVTARRSTTGLPST